MFLPASGTKKDRTVLLDVPKGVKIGSQKNFSFFQKKVLTFRETSGIVINVVSDKHRDPLV